MKKKTLCIVLVLLLCVSTIMSASAATLTATYGANTCHRGFTSSHYLQRSTSDNPWSWVKVTCTKSVYEGNEDILDYYFFDEHVLLLKNANGGAAAEEQDIYKNYGSDYNVVNLYNGQKGTTKLKFRVYNSYYYYGGIGTTNVKITCNVTGYLAS